MKLLEVEENLKRRISLETCIFMCIKRIRTGEAVQKCYCGTETGHVFASALELREPIHESIGNDVSTILKL